MSSTPLETPTTKEQLLAQINEEYAAFVALAQQVPPERRSEPISGALSLKDIVAHICDWENWMLLRMRSASAGETLAPRSGDQGETGAPGTDIDSVNAAIFERYQDADWETVWADLERTHEESLRELADLSESDLFDPARVKAVTGLDDGAAYMLVVSNTSDHYREHADELRAALGQ
jgi:hypothetical protein